MAKMPAIVAVRAAEISVDDENYVRCTLTQLWEELPLLLCGTLFVALAALPSLLLLGNTRLIPLASLAAALTAAPAWTAYCYLAGRNAVQRKPRLSDFPGALIHYYVRSCLLAIPLALLSTALLATLPGLTGSTPLLAVSGIVFQMLSLLILFLLGIYAFPLLALFDLSLRQAWTNSLILLLRWPLVATGLGSMVFLLALGARAIGPGAWAILPLILTPFAVNATLMLTKCVLDSQGRLG